MRLSTRPLVISLFSFFPYVLSAQYTVSLNPGLVYTLPGKKILYETNGQKAKFNIPVTNRIGISLDKRIEGNWLIGIQISVEDFDYGYELDGRVKGGSSGPGNLLFSTAKLGSGSNNILACLGLRFGYQHSFNEKNSLQIVLSPVFGLYQYNDFIADTATLNIFDWRNYDRMNDHYIVYENKQNTGLQLLANITAAYERKLSKRFGLGLSVTGQKGFTNFVENTMHMSRTNVSEGLYLTRLTGSSLQFCLNFKYFFGGSGRAQTLMRQNR
jgi:hypothetical protein